MTRWLAIAIVALVPTGIAAQSDVSREDLIRCAEILRGVERLDCFDALVRGLPGDTTPSSPPASTPSEAGSAAAADRFGAEQLEDSGNPEEIHSRLIGEFNGWSGDTVFRLENGQVWQQAESDRMIFSSTRPEVTIRRGAMNTYRLSVEGVRRAIRVRRIE